VSPAFQQNVPEGYIDLSSDEKLLAYWEKHCPPSDWAVTHRAVAAKRAEKPFQAYVLSFKETFECTLGPKKIADGQKL
jgi:hypothetical protein